jgi:hypothetical protein
VERRRTVTGRVVGRVCAACIAGTFFAACSQGQGSGVACGTLDQPACWTGSFNLQPTFFAAVPTQATSTSPRITLQIRIQAGGDTTAFSDGIAILVDDVDKMKSQLMQTQTVALPVGVTPVGVPIVADPNPSNVHASLYLQKSCRTQNVALYALREVSLNADGSCGQATLGPQNTCVLPTPFDGGLTLDGGFALDAGSSLDGGDAATGADGGAAPVTTGLVGTSTIRFDKIFSGDPNESNADKRLIDVPAFDFYFADPREIAPGGLGPPPPCHAHLAGHFSFFFQRGQPEQPFQ